MSAYPEHDKLDKVKDQSQELGFFMEWLMNRYTLCEWHNETEIDLGEDSQGRTILHTEPEGFYPSRPMIQHVLAEYFKIDYDKLMAEKDQMLADIRKANKS